MRSETISSQLITIARSGVVDLPTVPEPLLTLAQRHGLIGIMAHAEGPLRQSALPGFTRLRARQEVMVTVLRRLLVSLDAAGIPVAVLKGPKLAIDAYQNREFRTFTDIDILVRRQDLEGALVVIQRDSAVLEIPTKWPNADKRNVLCSDRGVEFTLDLHWDLFSHSQLRPGAEGATEAAWQLAEEVESELGPVWNLPPEADMAFLCAHAMLDHRFRLILFRDLAEVSRRFEAWEQLRSFCERWQLRSTTYSALLIADRAIGITQPAGFLRSLRPHSPLTRALEQLIDRIDIATFNGHGLHPLNLAVVLMADDWRQSIHRLVRAPLSVIRWRTRVSKLGSARHRRRGSHPTGQRMMLVVSGTRRRGAEVFGSNLAAGFRDRGWMVDLVALHGQPDGPTIHPDRIVRPKGRAGRLDLPTIAGLRTLIRHQRPDVVFANGGSTLRYAALALATIRPRPCFVYSSIGEPAYWLRGPLHRFFQGVLHRSTDHVLAVSDATRRQLTTLFRVPAHRTTVAHPGVGPEFFEVPETEPGDALRLLFVGSLSGEKDPASALEVAGSASTRCPVVIRFVGEGPLAEDIAERARAANLAAQVEFAGAVDDVRPHLQWADVLLVTSRTEGLPGVVLEAAAAGVPTVGFDVGGISETMVPGESGILVPYGDLEALTDAIVGLGSNPARASELGRNARALVHQRFSLADSVRWYGEVVEGVCRSKAND